MKLVMQSHFQNHTILAVTHRPSTVLDFDRVLVMESGRIVENGVPRELIGRPSRFLDLYVSAGEGG